ncbi:MAG: methylmalonyl Co-A mutase-associated GTPase MeaB [Porticoccaceae bacterium]
MTLPTQDPQQLAADIIAGNRRALAKGITLVESTHPDHRRAALELLAAVMPHTGGASRIGISGVPGVGKSTFIEAFGSSLIDSGHRVAVLAVDPTSALSGGSILGDKTRMQTLAFNPDAFIRPSPAGKTLGGVTRRTRESLLLCEAAGFDVVLIETVGVGQSETAVADMTDLFMLLLLPSGGDELQGIKRGIMELADLVVVNKADGDQFNTAQQTLADYRSALHFMQSRSAQWRPQALACSALHNQQIDAVWEAIQAFYAAMHEQGALAKRRAEQARSWMWSEMGESLLTDLRSDPRVKQALPTIEAKVVAGQLPATAAALELVEIFRSSR